MIKLKYKSYQLHLMVKIACLCVTVQKDIRVLIYEAQIHDRIRHRYRKILKFKIRYDWDTSINFLI